MNKIELFATDVSQELTGKSVDDAKIDPVTVVAIVTAVMDIVMEIIDKCKENNPERVATTIKNPGLFNRVKFNRLVRDRLREEDVAGFTYWQVAEACSKVAQKRSLEEVKGLVEETKQLDYWLI